MKFMLIVKATKDSEAGPLPKHAAIAEMTKFKGFVEEMTQAGVLLDMNGLQRSSLGARVKFSGRKRTVVDGPFAETKELIAGYWLIQVKSRAEAIEWARRSPNPAISGKDGEIEVRQLFELEDIGEGPEIDEVREFQEKHPRRK